MTTKWAIYQNNVNSKNNIWNFRHPRSICKTKIMLIDNSEKNSDN